MYLTLSQYKYRINESQFNLLNENIFKQIGSITKNKMINNALNFFDVDEDLIEDNIRFRDLLNKDIELIKKLHLSVSEIKVFLKNLILKLQVLPINIQVSLFKTVMVSLVALISYQDVMGIFNTIEPQKTSIDTSNIIYEGFPELEKVVADVYNKTTVVANKDTKVSTTKTNKQIKYFAPKEFSDTLVNFLKYEEGSVTDKGEPVLTAYALGDGMVTIGFGHAEKTSNTKMIPGVTTISYDQAVDLLVEDIKEAQGQLDDILKEWKDKKISYNLTQGQYDAMISMIYNMGIGNFRQSDFIQDVKHGDMDIAAQKIKETNVTWAGHVPRREKEAKLFASFDVSNFDYTTT